MQNAAYTIKATKAKFVTAAVCKSINDSVILKSAKPTGQRDLHLLTKTE